MTVPSNIYVQNVVLALLAQIVGHPYETGGTRFWYSIIQHHCVGLFDWAWLYIASTRWLFCKQLIARKYVQKERSKLTYFQQTFFQSQQLQVKNQVQTSQEK